LGTDRPTDGPTDIVTYRAAIAAKNMELNQEFHFASGITKWNINNIYHNHYYGSPIWDIFGQPVKSFLCSYNVSVRNMFNLPQTTHRRLIETVSGCRQLFVTLASRFLGFLDKIKESDKVIPKMLLEHVMHDVRSTTGSNMRRIMLAIGKDDICELKKCDAVKLEYHKLEKSEAWRGVILTELIAIAEEGNGTIMGFSDDEIRDIMHFICTS